MTGSVDKTKLLMSFEKTFAVTAENTSEFLDLNDVRKSLFNHLLDVGNSHGIDEILAIELAILENERKHYGNSAGMRTSLDAGIHEVKQCQYMLEVVRDPTRYEEINRSLALPKSRKGLLPMDDARKAFRAHATRLTNLDRSRLTEPEKQIITVRHKNLGVAEKAYIALQQKALGIAPVQKAKSAGIEM